jgi:oxalate decarboxylase
MMNSSESHFYYDNKIVTNNLLQSLQYQRNGFPLLYSQVESRDKQLNVINDPHASRKNSVYSDNHTVNVGSDIYYHLSTDEVIYPSVKNDIGKVIDVDKSKFPALKAVSTVIIEIWEEGMRVPHWHPNCNELGYVISGIVDVYIWRSFGEASVFTVPAGSCWFIPQGALHCINNIGSGVTKFFEGFDNDMHDITDIPVAFNGLPNTIRTAYTSPHSELTKWIGMINNPLIQKSTFKAIHHDSSPYRADFDTVPPLFNNPKIGSVIWIIKNNWSILKGISILRARLNPGSSRDAIWYPDAGTLYIITHGTAQYTIIKSGMEPTTFDVKMNDYIYIPVGTLHTFKNMGSEMFEVIAYFTKANPLPEVSLSVSTNFFPRTLITDSLTYYYGQNKISNPLNDFKNYKISPYLFGSISSY